MQAFENENYDIINRTSEDVRSEKSEGIAGSSASASEAQSVLIVGATGRAGLEVLKQLAERASPPLVYGLTRNIRTVSQKVMDHYSIFGEELIEGDATKGENIYRALLISQADTIIVAIGNDKTKKSKNVRSTSAKAITQVLLHPQFRHIRVLVVSWAGAGSSKADCRMCIRRFEELKMKATLNDHTKQEEIFLSDKTIRDRTTIVRPTNFSRSDNPSTLKVFADGDKTIPKLPKTRPMDLAKWLAAESISAEHAGSTINFMSDYQ